eukprot:8168167-Alexandrium_andersonii.AAC.1
MGLPTLRRFRSAEMAVCRSSGRAWNTATSGWVNYCSPLDRGSADRAVLPYASDRVVLPIRYALNAMFCH